MDIYIVVEFAGISTHGYAYLQEYMTIYAYV